VLPDGPAAKAGLKSGDVVLEFKGQPVRDSRHFKLEVARTQPGETAPMKIWRDGSSREIKVTLDELPGSPELAQAGSSNADQSERLVGVTVSDLDPQVRRELGLPDYVQGAVVTDVDPDSAAAEAGLSPGDVIMEINRHKVKNAEDAVKLTRNQKDTTTLLRVWSQKGSRYVVVEEKNMG